MTDYLGRVILIRRWLLCANIYKSKSEIYGYVTGESFANQLGLTTQMPAVIEVVTNREATNGRTITVGSERVRIKKGSDLWFQIRMLIFYSYLTVLGRQKSTRSCQFMRQ